MVSLPRLIARGVFGSVPLKHIAFLAFTSAFSILVRRVVPRTRGQQFLSSRRIRRVLAFVERHIGDWDTNSSVPWDSSLREPLFQKSVELLVER